MIQILFTRRICDIWHCKAIYRTQYIINSERIYIAVECTLEHSANGVSFHIIVFIADLS